MVKHKAFKMTYNFIDRYSAGEISFTTLADTPIIAMEKLYEYISHIESAYKENWEKENKDKKEKDKSFYAPPVYMFIKCESTDSVWI